MSKNKWVGPSQKDREAVSEACLIAARDQLGELDEDRDDISVFIYRISRAYLAVRKVERDADTAFRSRHKTHDPEYIHGHYISRMHIVASALASDDAHPYSIVGYRYLAFAKAWSILDAIGRAEAAAEKGGDDGDIWTPTPEIVELAFPDPKADPQSP